MVAETKEIEAGPELDALIAEKVMGFAKPDADGLYAIGDELWRFCPSTDIRCAWLVVEEMDRRCAHIRFHNALSAVVGSELIYKLLFGTIPAPLAICRAALAVSLAHPER